MNQRGKSESAKRMTICGKMLEINETGKYEDIEFREKIYTINEDSDQLKKEGRGFASNVDHSVRNTTTKLRLWQSEVFCSVALMWQSDVMTCI